MKGSPVRVRASALRKTAARAAVSSPRPRLDRLSRAAVGSALEAVGAHASAKRLSTAPGRRRTRRQRRFRVSTGRSGGGTVQQSLPSARWRSALAATAWSRVAGPAGDQGVARATRDRAGTRRVKGGGGLGWEAPRRGHLLALVPFSHVAMGDRTRPRDTTGTRRRSVSRVVGGNLLHFQRGPEPRAASPHFAGVSVLIG